MVGASDSPLNGEVLEPLKGLKLEGGDDEAEPINGSAPDTVRLHSLIAIHACLLVN